MRQVIAGVGSVVLVALMWPVEGGQTMDMHGPRAGGVWAALEGRVVTVRYDGNNGATATREFNARVLAEHERIVVFEVDGERWVFDKARVQVVP